MQSSVVRSEEESSEDERVEEVLGLNISSDTEEEEEDYKENDDDDNFNKEIEEVQYYNLILMTTYIMQAMQHAVVLWIALAGKKIYIKYITCWNIS